MKRVRASLSIAVLALAMVLLGTSCAKEEVIAPASAAHGTVKSTGNPDPTFNDEGDGTVDPKGGDPDPDPTTISDDGDDQGDRERGRGKRGH